MSSAPSAVPTSRRTNDSLAASEPVVEFVDIEAGEFGESLQCQIMVGERSVGSVPLHLVEVFGTLDRVADVFPLVTGDHRRFPVALALDRHGSAPEAALVEVPEPIHVGHDDLIARDGAFGVRHAMVLVEAPVEEGRDDVAEIADREVVGYDHIAIDLGFHIFDPYPDFGCHDITRIGV